MNIFSLHSIKIFGSYNFVTSNGCPHFWSIAIECIQNISLNLINTKSKCNNNNSWELKSSDGNEVFDSNLLHTYTKFLSSLTLRSYPSNNYEKVVLDLTVWPLDFVLINSIRQNKGELFRSSSPINFLNLQEFWTHSPSAHSFAQLLKKIN